MPKAYLLDQLAVLLLVLCRKLHPLPLLGQELSRLVDLPLQVLGLLSEAVNFQAQLLYFGLGNLDVSY
jgi:hypothetical protein